MIESEQTGQSFAQYHDSRRSESDRDSLRGQWLYRLFILISLTLILISFLFLEEPWADPRPIVPLALIILAGLPHGALDIHIALNGLQDHSAASRFDILFLYITIGVIGGVAWIIAPAYLVAFFLTLSVWHFSGDFSALGRMTSLLIASSILLMPMLSHASETMTIFAMLIPAEQAATMISMARWAWPVIVLAALALLFRFYRSPMVALAGITSILAGLLLDPISAFALYFALLHSPLHVYHVLRRYPVKAIHLKEAGLYAGMTFGLLGAMAALWWVYGADAPLIGAVFGLLIVLTLPHMAIVEHWQRGGANAAR